MIDTLLQDLRYAARTFRRSPGFLLLTVLTIAIGVGANAVIFSIVNAVLLQPLPFPRPNDLVLVTDMDRQTRQNHFNTSPANFLDWRARQHSFTGMAAFRQATFTMSTAEHPERVAGAIVNASFLDVLDVRPAAGRGFVAGDEQPGAPRVAVLSDGFWRQRFGARADAIGRTVRVNDEPHTIVGVMPPGVDYPDRAGIWVTPHLARAGRSAGADGRPFVAAQSRLCFGAGAASAGRNDRGGAVRHGRGRVDPRARLSERQHEQGRPAAAAAQRPLTRRNFSVTLLSGFGTVAVSLAAIGLYAVVTFIVAQRRREIGIRMALGAQPRDVVADVLGQGLRLAGLGVVVGIGLALAATRLLNSLLFGTSPTDALTFAAAAALLVAIAACASLVPALRASRVDPLVALRDE